MLRKSGSYKQTRKNEAPGGGLGILISGKRKQVLNNNKKSITILNDMFIRGVYYCNHLVISAQMSLLKKQS